jgi:hypothetical protein
VFLAFAALLLLLLLLPMLLPRKQSAKAVMNMNHVGEGEFIRRTAPVALLFVLMAQALGLVFTLGGALPDKPMPLQ